MIGEHIVTLIPDPDAQNWGPTLNSNAFFNADVAGWAKAPFVDGDPITWAAPGLAVLPTNMTTGAVGIYRADTAPIARDASTQYRVRAKVTVSAAGWVIVGMYYGKTPAAAYAGDFWWPDDAKNQSAWFNAPGPGTYTFEITLNPNEIPVDYGFVGPYAQFYVQTGAPLVALAPKIDSLELNGQGAVAHDISCLVDQVSIHHGRDDAGSQPEASTATLDLSLDTGSTALPDFDVGDILRVETRTAITNSIRFVGRITDIAMGWEAAGENTPNALSLQIQAASAISELGRRIVGDTPWPQELDGSRVARIMTLAGVTLDPTYSDPGKVQILARDVDSQPALDLAWNVAQSSGGIVWQTRSGEVRYADSEHRRGAVSSLTLDACDILVTPTWQRTTEGIINKVAIAYGVAPAGGEQPQYTDQRADSQAAYGRYELSQSTSLAALADAQALATMYLTRNVTPVWILQALPVDMRTLDDQETAAILGLDMHALISVSGLPAGGSVPTNTSLWVEGWSETLAYGEHDLLLSVSGYCRTSPPPRWDDVAPDTTWDTSGGTWDAWACQGPLPSLGRWTDVPASTRWNNAQIPWDNWV